MIDPHTAVAKAVIDTSSQQASRVPLIISSTAHFSKFSDGILNAFGVHPFTDNAGLMMKAALNMTDRPSLHRQLWNDVNMSRHDKQVSTILSVYVTQTNRDIFL